MKLDDWKAGDLAECINNGDLLRPDTGVVLVGGQSLVLKRIYRVKNIKLRPDIPKPFNLLLELEEEVGGPKLAIRFRKIIPDHSGDIVDQETFDMIKRTVLVPAS